MDLPCFRVMDGPTPLEEAKALTRHLGGPRIFFKRDDLTGAGLGGNKVRKLEYILGRALAEGCDTLIVCGGYQSNLARIASAMGARAGLDVQLVLGGVAGEARPETGNLLLDRLLGATIHFVETEPRWDFGTAIEDLAATLRARGRRPFVMPLGGSSPEGMAGYVDATAELLTQCEHRRILPDHLYVAVGSGGTCSGLLLGATNLNAPYAVTGISVSRTTDFLRDKIAAETREARQMLGLARTPERNTLRLFDDYVGDGYGALTEGALDAIALVGRLEGVLLDPVYSGKAMHGLIDHIRRGLIGAGETVVFLHTGGSPALFAYDSAALLACPKVPV